MDNTSQILAPSVRFIIGVEKGTGVSIDSNCSLSHFISSIFLGGHYHFRNIIDCTKYSCAVRLPSQITPKKIR